MGNMQQEMDMLLDRINKMSDMLDKSRREKEDALIELENHKEKLDKEKMNVKIISEEKDMNNKEFERLLEKFDRGERGAPLDSSAEEMAGRLLMNYADGTKHGEAAAKSIN